jgi:hypothetical protein
MCFLWSTNVDFILHSGQSRIEWLEILLIIKTNPALGDTLISNYLRGM